MDLAHSQTSNVIPSPDYSSRTWCKHHPTKCKREIKHQAHYGRGKIDGHKVSANKGSRPASNLTKLSTAVDNSRTPSAPAGCTHHSLAKSYGGVSLGNGKYLDTFWVQHFNVNWCWNSRGQITANQYASHSMNHFWWSIEWSPLNDKVTSEWYPWSHSFRPKHNGRFEGIDSETQTCLGFYGITCFMEKHPWIHVHEHGDGSYTYNWAGS